MRKVKFRIHFGVLAVILIPISVLAKDQIILIKEEHKTKTERDVHITFTAHYPFEPEVIWKILTEIEDFKNVLPRFKESQILQRHPQKDTKKRRQKAYVKVGIPWPIPDVWNHLMIETDSRVPHFLRWRRVLGSFRRNSGTILLSPNEYGCKLVLEINANPGSGVPMWIVRWGIRSYLPDLLQTVFKVAEKRSSISEKTVN